MNVTKYKMTSEKDVPLFNFLVKSVSSNDYYLYESFHDAIEMAILLNKEKNERINIYENFMSQIKEWYLQNFFYILNEQLMMNKNDELGFYAKRYLDDGTWLNPNEEWLEKLKV